MIVSWSEVLFGVETSRLKTGWEGGGVGGTEPRREQQDWTASKVVVMETEYEA